MTLQQKYNAMKMAQIPEEQLVFAALYQLGGGMKVLPDSVLNIRTEYSISLVEIAKRYLCCGLAFTKVTYTKATIERFVKELESLLQCSIAYRTDGISVELRNEIFAFRFTRGDEKDAIRAFYAGFVTRILIQKCFGGEIRFEPMLTAIGNKANELIKFIK